MTDRAPALPPLHCAALLADVSALIAARTDVASLEEPIDFYEFFRERFLGAHLDPVGSTDLKRALYAELAAKESMLLEHRERLKTYLASLQIAMTALVDTTIETLQIHPHVNFCDSLGGKLRLQLNAQHKLEIDDGAVPEEYYTTKTVRVIDKERIKLELAEGRELPFAHSLRGTHLKGLK